VSIAPDGSAYQVSDSFIQQGPGFGGDSRILVSKSTDGGQTWGTPVVLLDSPEPSVLNDKESVTADPTSSTRVFVVWDQLVSPSKEASPDGFLHTFAFRGPAFLAMTSDGGTNWQKGHIIFDPGQNKQTIGNQIVVLPDGTLIDGIDLIFSTASKSGRIPTSLNVALLRSTDHGATWSSPTIVSPIVDAPVHTLDGQAVRTGDILPAWAVDPKAGTLYTAWQDGSFASDGHAQIAFSRSTDGGLHWSTAVRINKVATTQAYTPQIFVSSDGTVGVTYYDMRNATKAAPGQTNLFMVNCSAATTDCTNPGNWSENQLDAAAGFDVRTAPLTVEGYFLGDYEGLTARGTTFGPFFILSQPEATHGPTDPFSTSVGP
jgi:Neuraminidase (sialidase)